MNPKRLKRSDIVNYAIIAVLIIINLFWLPTFGHWSINTKQVLSQSAKLSLFSDFHSPPEPKINLSPAPAVEASAYIVIDNDTNKILISKNPNGRIYPASITKLATSLTALNLYPLDEIITIENTYNEGKVMGLVENERISVRSLTSALLVYSANDAAYNLAKHHPQNISGFVNDMNLLMTKYNLKDTHFINFDGLHNENHYSTVYDLSQLGRIALKNSFISSTVKNKSIEVSDIAGENKHFLESTNELLGKIPEVEGLKTGWTPEAGGCFISVIDLSGHRLISVVADSPDRFGDTTKIINWAKSNVSW